MGLLEQVPAEQDSALRLAAHDMAIETRYGQRRSDQVAPISLARSRITKRKAGWTELDNSAEAKKVGMASADCLLVSWACKANSQLLQGCCTVQQGLFYSSEEKEIRDLALDLLELEIEACLILQKCLCCAAHGGLCQQR